MKWSVANPEKMETYANPNFANPTPQLLFENCNSYYDWALINLDKMSLPTQNNEDVEEGKDKTVKPLAGPL